MEGDEQKTKQRLGNAKRGVDVKKKLVCQLGYDTWTPQESGLCFRNISDLDVLGPGRLRWSSHTN